MKILQISELEKAIKSLEESIRLHSNAAPDSPEQMAFRDSTIQRFEFSIELSWKVAKKIMGTSSSAPRSIVREMAQDSLIDDPSIWLEFIDARNKSSHTYDENIAREVFKIAKMYCPYGRKLLEILKER